MERKIITIKDIAEKTGVSKSTVSRVLCNDVHVSPETREKVLSCARDMNFKPKLFCQGPEDQEEPNHRLPCAEYRDHDISCNYPCNGGGDSEAWVHHPSLRYPGE